MKRKPRQNPLEPQHNVRITSRATYALVWVKCGPDQYKPVSAPMGSLGPFERYGFQPDPGAQCLVELDSVTRGEVLPGFSRYAAVA